MHNACGDLPASWQPARKRKSLVHHGCTMDAVSLLTSLGVRSRSSEMPRFLTGSRELYSSHRSPSITHCRCREGYHNFSQFLEHTSDEANLNRNIVRTEGEVVTTNQICPLRTHVHLQVLEEINVLVYKGEKRHTCAQNGLHAHVLANLSRGERHQHSYSTTEGGIDKQLRATRY